MKYQGGKHRTGKQIVETIMDQIPENHSGIFYDLFCGSCAVIKHVPKSFVRIANDKDYDLILLYQHVQLGIIPDYTKEQITKEQYYQIKEYQSPHYMKAYAGIFGSYAGKKWGGYAKGENRDYFQEATKGLHELKPDINSVFFASADYTKINVVPNSIIYLDPPYKGTTGYKHTIDYDLFYDYLDYLSNEKQCHIFVSEYTMPNHYEIIWSKKQKTSLTLTDNNNNNRIDKLWRFKQ